MKWSALKKSFGDVRFFKEKVHSLSVAPEPLAIWNKKLEGLESLCCLKILEDLVLKKSFGDVRFFEEKVHSLSVAPEPLAIWNKS